MKSLLITSTGISIQKYKDDVSKWMDKVPTLAWGHSFYFLLEHIGKIPKYWSFIDLSSIRPSLNKILCDKKVLDTELICLSPITTVSLAEQLKHTGYPKYIKTEEDYKNHLDLIERCKQYIKVSYVKSAGIDNNVSSNYNIFLSDYVLVRSLDDKLIGCILPLVYKMGYRQLYLVGFDGKNRQFHNKEKSLGNFKRMHKNKLTYLDNYIRYGRFELISIVPHSQTTWGKYGIPYQNA